MKITATTYAQAFLSATANTSADEVANLTKRLWRVVWRKKHWNMRHDIIREISLLKSGEVARVPVQVASARPLTETELHKLESQISEALGSPIALQVEVKPHLLAGMLVTVADRRFDGSLKGRLDKVYRALAGETN